MLKIRNAVAVALTAVALPAAVVGGQTPPAPAPAPLAAQPSTVAAPQIIEQVLVKVNGDIITKSDLEERQIAALRNSKINPEILKNDEQLQKALVDITPQVLVSTIDELLLTQLGREKGFKLTDDQFNKWLTDMRKDNNLEDNARFEAALKQEGVTMSDLRKNVERGFIMNQVQREEFGGKLQITEEEARQYYQANQKEFVEPASVTLREILIEVQTTNQDGKPMINVGRDDEAAKTAAAARARVMAGEDFAKVAAEVSSGSSKANGGLIGPIAVSEVSQDLQKLIDKMKPGDVTEPIRTARGYQLLKLDTVKTAAVRPFDSVRDIVADRVYQERANVEMKKFLDRVRRQAIIVWKNEELRKAYEQQVAARGGSNPG
jgi:peptidyl-prolyl cis-trans isomerase SurA